MPSLHQARVSAYHQAIAAPGVGGGHDHHGHHAPQSHNMHLIHRDWHQNNRDPEQPSAPDPDWGTDLDFGSDFLQMHHEMVNATAAEPHQQMMHASIVQWYGDNQFALPAEWDPAAVIPAELGYDPDENEFPDEIKNAVVAAAAHQGISVKTYLTRATDQPAFTLPRWFTLEGVAAGEDGEPLTGARKLADFQNRNQLGCCLVYPHNTWHGRIGGAMRSTWTAIADPIFYFGVHWWIDKVFDLYKQVEAQHVPTPPAPAGIAPLTAKHFAKTPMELRKANREFTLQQKALLKQWRMDSLALHRPLGGA